METIVIEIIRTLFISLALLLIAWVLRPMVRFLRSPMPSLNKAVTERPFEETEEELQIPNNDDSKSYNPSEVLNTARRSPLMTSQTIRHWLKENSQLKTHA